MNNFGDLLGPMVVKAVASSLRLDLRAQSRPGRLLSVGSVLHFAQDGDTVWGSGVNGKVDADYSLAGQLKIRAVRGPLTRRVLEQAGHEVPAIYGDPGLLFPRFFAAKIAADEAPARNLVVVPNLNDLVRYKAHDALIDPRSNLWTIAASILRADFVAASSLHAIVLADAMGIPNRLIESRSEHSFKYRDYYEGTGRELPQVARDVDDAVKLGASDRLNWDSQPLIDAFPAELWSTGPGKVISHE